MRHDRQGQALPAEAPGNRVHVGGPASAPSREIVGFPVQPAMLGGRDLALDVVAITKDLPERDPYRRKVGTVVEIVAPGVFGVEFS